MEFMSSFSYNGPLSTTRQHAVVAAARRFVLILRNLFFACEELPQ